MITALLTSPQFWVALLTLVGSIISIWWYYVGRDADKAKEQKEATQTSEKQEQEAKDHATAEQPKINDSIQKQTEARDKFEFEERK